MQNMNSQHDSEEHSACESNSCIQSRLDSHMSCDYFHHHLCNNGKSYNDNLQQTKLK